MENIPNIHISGWGRRIGWSLTWLWLIITTQAFAQSISITSPNTPVVWQGNTIQNITWTGVGFSNVYIELTTNNGSTWTHIATQSLTSGTYSWTVTPVQGGSNQCRIRLSDVINPAVFSVSAVPFTIPPPIIVAFPNGNETFQNGQIYPIRWSSDPSVNTVLIEYSTDNGNAWTQIATNVQARQQFYPWTVPSVSSLTMLVRITNTANTIIRDQSDAVFTVNSTVQRTPTRYTGGGFDGYSMTSNLTPAIQVTSPNSPVVWLGNTYQQISWTYTNVAQVLLEFSSNNGSSWNTITTTAASANTFQWVVPPVQGGSNQCLVRASDALNPALFDVSDTQFTIPPPITVLYPNGNEAFQNGQIYPVRWLTDPSVSTVLIEYSTNNGGSWTQIATNVQATQQFYPWTVPSVNSASMLVRVTNTANSTIHDASDAVFSASATVQRAPARYFGGSFDGYSMRSNITPAIQVTSPNTSVVWLGNTFQQISWTYTNVSQVMLEFSSNNG